jgi:His/Glu/Gln/Arg/opine family amino acid ABC transporter permease subunit
VDFQASYFWGALTSLGFLQSVAITISLTVVAELGGIVLGLVLAIMRGSHWRLLRGFSWGYIWVFRAVPTLVQLLFVWNALPQLIPALKQQWFSAFLAAAIALSMNEGAYMAEIIRGGLLSIDDGQALAARALGMSPLSVFRKVLAPQLTRVIIPPTTNEFITMLKITSLASVISLRELLTYTQQQIASTFRFAEFYAAAAVYYLILVSILMIIQSQIESRFTWSSQGRDQTTIGRLRALGGSIGAR